MRRASAVLCLVSALSLLPNALSAKEKGPAHGINFYSMERELALGRQLSTELERQIKLVDDPILGEYVNRLAQNLARQSDLSIPVNVKIIESADLNAFTLPGGHIYVNSAMLRLTESESELAFVLAHELGHVAARHATREATRGDLVQLGAIPLWVLGGWSGVAARELAQSGSKLGMMKGARAFESEADLLGVEYLDRAGYDPGAAIDVFERIAASERKRPGRIDRLYGDHPMTVSRILETQKRANALTARRSEWVINTSEYEDMRLRTGSVEAKRLASEQTTSPKLVRAAGTP